MQVKRIYPKRSKYSSRIMTPVTTPYTYKVDVRYRARVKLYPRHPRFGSGRPKNIDELNRIVNEHKKIIKRKMKRFDGVSDSFWSTDEIHRTKNPFPPLPRLTPRPTAYQVKYTKYMAAKHGKKPMPDLIPSPLVEQMNSNKAENNASTSAAAVADSDYVNDTARGYSGDESALETEPSSSKTRVKKFRKCIKTPGRFGKSKITLLSHPPIKTTEKTDKN